MLNFILKATLGVTVMMWVRWTLPRFRFDQLMGLAWKVLMTETPLANDASRLIIGYAAMCASVIRFLFKSGWRFGTSTQRRNR